MNSTVQLFFQESTAPRFPGPEQTIVTSPITQQPSVTQAVPQPQSASPYDNVDEDATRGNDVSSLVRRFSGSDYDNKERSPTPKRTLGGSTLKKAEISALRYVRMHNALSFMLNRELYLDY